MIPRPDDVERFSRFCAQVNRAVLRLPAVVADVTIVTHDKYLTWRDGDRIEIYRVRKRMAECVSMGNVRLPQLLTIPINQTRAAVDCISAKRDDAFDLPYSSARNTAMSPDSGLWWV